MRIAWALDTILVIWDPQCEAPTVTCVHVADQELPAAA